jgi:hypothetical protein
VQGWGRKTEELTGGRTGDDGEANKNSRTREGAKGEQNRTCGWGWTKKSRPASGSSVGAVDEDRDASAGEGVGFLFGATGKQAGFACARGLRTSLNNRGRRSNARAGAGWGVQQPGEQSSSRARSRESS